MERLKCWSNSISEFWLPGFQISGDGNVKDPSQESRSCKIQNPEIPKEAHQQRISHTGRKIHFRVLVTGRWRSQESRLSNTGVSKSRNVKPRNREIGAPLKVLDTGISVTGRWRCQRLTSTGLSKL
jgi:hypothetical protein